MAGPATKLQRIFEHPAFSDEATKPQRRPLLRHDNNVLHFTSLVPLVPGRFVIMKRMFEPYLEIRFP